MKSKNFIIPVSILAVVFIFSITVLLLMKNFTENLNNTLEKAYDAACIDDFDSCKEYSYQFANMLDKAEPLLGYVVHHNEIDSVKWASERMLELADEESKNDYLAENRAIKDMIYHLYEIERPVPQNII